MRYVSILLIVCLFYSPSEAKQTKWKVTKIDYDKINMPDQSPKKGELDRIKQKPKSRAIEGDDPEYVAWFVDFLNTDSSENLQFREGFLEAEKGILNDLVPVGFWNSAKPEGGQQTWAEYMPPYLENATHVLFVLDRAGLNGACRQYPPDPQKILNPWAETFGADAILPKAQGLELIRASYQPEKRP